MRKPRSTALIFAEANQSAALIERLGEHFIVEQFDTDNTNRRYFDTFDWRLYRAKRLFYAGADTISLCTLDESPVGRAAVAPAESYFWWDIADSGIAEQLAPIIGVRALIPLFNAQLSTARYRLLNKDQKIVVRMEMETTVVDGVGGDQLHMHGVSFEEVRGYDEQYDTATSIGAACGGQAPAQKASRLINGLSVSGRTPLDYTSKFAIALPPEIPIGRAVSAIFLDLAGTMKRNHDGVMDDVDSEFLHDFRVAVRRARSLLSLFRKVLPEAERDWFQQEFKWLGSATGPVRDIDVYLLARQHYSTMIPASLSGGLAPFFDELAGHRKAHLSALRGALASQRYQRLHERLHEFCTHEQSPLFTEMRAGRCKKLVDELILKRFKRFVRDGGAITDDSSDEVLHRLRINGKKFRYLLEFFSSFYAPEDMSRFVRHMKKLQDNLGDFNDLSVQQDLLLGKLDELSGRGKRTMKLAAALGGLIAALADRHRVVRGEFNATYAAFATDQNIRLLKSMVTGKRPGCSSTTSR
jgi:CHAD domain-containing protein